MCFITRCCIQWCRTKCSRELAGEFTLKNLTGASANFAIIGEHGDGKTKIFRDFYAEPTACGQLIFSAFFLFDAMPLPVATEELLLRFRHLWPMRPFRRPGRRRYVLF